MDFDERLRRANQEVAGRDSELAKELETVRQRAHEQRESMQAQQPESMLESRLAFTDYETIVRRTGRPVLTIRSGEANLATLISDAESAIWRERLDRARQKLALAIPSVGRIDVEGGELSWLGTGWLVGDDVIVTNRHVAKEFARLDGEKFVFRRAIDREGPMRARVDYLHEAESGGAAPFDILDVLYIEPDHGPDVAFLRVARDPTRSRITLSAEAPDPGRLVAVIGYPARDSRIPEQELMERIFGNVYDRKRLAPGNLIAVEEDAIQHDCSTLGGNSGSVVLDLASGSAVALHFSGTFLTANYAVPAAEIRRLYDRYVVGGRGRSRAPTPVPPSGETQGRPPAGSGGTTSLAVTIPIRIRIDVGDPTRDEGREAIPGEAGEVERVEEGRSEDYSSRRGYDEDFLGAGRKVSLPRVKDKDDVLQIEVGEKTEDVLKYEHFSVSISKSRRMCHYSAVNIDGSKSRKVARGPWRLDPRIGAQQQIIHECYGNAPKFSRGHMTRREDPVWGTPAEAKRGNDDSMHVTNVVPQMQSFNAPIWLGLESYALGHAREDKMRLCVFTGPFFDEDDPTMHGVRIPRSFWKVIAFVHDQTKKLCATGYTISQEGELPAREFVYGEYTALTGVPAQVSLRSIEQKANVSFGALTALDAKARVREGPGAAEPETTPLRAFGDIAFF